MKSYEVRERIVALVCLTAIAMVAMANLSDPENVVVNIVVAIAAFITGGGGQRKTDKEDSVKEAKK